MVVVCVVDFVELVLLAVGVVLEESAMSDQLEGKTFQFITFVLNAGDTSHFCDTTGPKSRVRAVE